MSKLPARTASDITSSLPGSGQSATPLEVECKFRVSEFSALAESLKAMGANFLSVEHQSDRYLAHPSRDFRETDEALRIRQLDNSAVVTYKGPRISGPVKIRPETEIPLVDQTADIWFELFHSLGFRSVATVTKTRRSFTLVWRNQTLTIALDDVQQVGQFVEIEIVVQDRNQVDESQKVILELAKQLKLTDIEKRSYLAMLLQQSEC